MSFTDVDQSTGCCSTRRNVELKARAVGDLREMSQRARAIADGDPLEINQDDTFFRSAVGRLKLRKFSATKGELIHYSRQDEAGPKESRYLIASTDTPDEMRAVLSTSLGELGEVSKRRLLFLVGGDTRIHLDSVEGLGTYVEIEVVLKESQTVAYGEAEALRIMGQLGIGSSDLVGESYFDLLKRT